MDLVCTLKAKKANSSSLTYQQDESSQKLSHALAHQSVPHSQSS